MNTNVGLIGKKLGNTQVFNDDGSVARVTVIQVGPCRVLGKRTLDKDGYSAVILGYIEAFFNLISPVIALIYGFTGFRIERLPEAGAGDDSTTPTITPDRPPDPSPAPAA